MVTERGVTQGGDLIRIVVDYRSDTLGRWPGIEQRWPNAVRTIAFERAKATRQRMKQDLRKLLARELRRPFTGRMMAALDARIGPAGAGTSFPWISWGYFPNNVSGANQEDDNYRSLQNYFRAREHGVASQAAPPISRIAFYLESQGKSRRGAWPLAQSLMAGREGANVLEKYRSSSSYESRVNGAIRGLGLSAFRMAMGRDPTGGEMAELGGTLQ